MWRQAKTLKVLLAFLHLISVGQRNLGWLLRHAEAANCARVPGLVQTIGVLPPLIRCKIVHYVRT